MFMRPLLQVIGNSCSFRFTFINYGNCSILTVKLEIGKEKKRKEKKEKQVGKVMISQPAYMQAVKQHSN